MKSAQPLLTTSLIAAVALTAHRFAAFDGTVCAAGAKALGSVVVDTDADNVAPVDVLGIVLVEAGAAIAAGAVVQSDATGRAITKAAGEANGTAWDAATAAGDVIRVVRGI